VGVWRRDFEKDTVAITLKRFIDLSEAEAAAVTRAAEQYGAFLDLTVRCE
jgi:hypothetical protein